jgi:hypothetical protein
MLAEWSPRNAGDACPLRRPPDPPVTTPRHVQRRGWKTSLCHAAASDAVHGPAHLHGPSGPRRAGDRHRSFRARRRILSVYPPMAGRAGRPLRRPSDPPVTTPRHVQRRGRKTSLRHAAASDAVHGPTHLHGPSGPRRAGDRHRSFRARRRILCVPAHGWAGTDASAPCSMPRAAHIKPAPRPHEPER